MEPIATLIIGGCRGGLLMTLTLMVTLVGALNDPVLSPGLFYPFGSDVGDSVMTPNDDGSSGNVTINVGFPFFATSNNRLFVNTNGAISFGQQVSIFTPERFPVAYRIIAPYWCDIDTTRNRGRVYYRQTTDEALLNRATQDVVRSFSSKGLYFFKAKWIFIATWHNVTYFGGSATTPMNNFQAVLITDGKHSMAMFNYGRMNWTAGTASGGNATTGLGGIAAQVGFNAGDNLTFFAVPGSREASIVDIGDYTNVGQKGRWLFRVDNATIEVSSNVESSGSKCKAYQEFNQKAKTCLDVAPAFDYPKLEGPVVIKRCWVEFYCVIPTNETNQEAGFNVTFLFNGEPRVPSVTVWSPTPKATLHEKDLTHKLLGKWISCRVFSFWRNSPTDRKSTSVTSSNSYWAGIEVSPDVISVHEGDPNPVILTLKSTLPITCRRVGVDSCDLTLRFSSTKDILIRGRKKRACSTTLTEADWKEEERKAYKEEEKIEVYAKIDYAVSAPRFNTLTIDIDEVHPKFSEDGKQYASMWSKHSLPPVMVYHHDVPQGVCRSTGDPNLTTFDRFFYSVYASGQFTYVQTTSGTPIEVHVRHKPCGPAVSCVCGVAIREENLILIAEKCNGEELLRTVTFNNPKDLPEHVGVKQSENGLSFEMTLPGKVRVVGHLSSWRMSIQIYVTSAEYRRIEGLCGSFDGNSANDLKVKGSSQTHSPSSASLQEVVESWRVPNGHSLFDNTLSNLNTERAEQSDDSQSYCSCPEPPKGCGNGVVDNTIPFENGVGDPFENNTRNTLKWVPPHMSNRIIPTRRRRQAENFTVDIDDIDWEYDAGFNYSSPEPPRRPENASGLSEEDARRYCQRVLWDESAVRPSCENLVSMNDVNGIIGKCVSDIRMTGDMSWADDKIPEIQSLCLFEAVTANITESNSTMEDIASVVQEIAAVVCLPQDCSGHGTCRNGTCFCNKGYVGSDCALSEDAVPDIVRILKPSSCDLSRFPCQRVDMVAKNVTSLPTLVCKVEVTKLDDAKQSFMTSASVESMETTSCKLPTDVLKGSLHLLQTNSSSAPSQQEDKPTDFHSIPLGGSLLRYAISISNNGRRFSNRHPVIVYDARCYSCNGQLCSQKKDTCLINGYCFENGQRNPFNPDCDRCSSSVSSTTWTKVSDLLCDPCLSSPCSAGSICQSFFKGRHQCIHAPTQQDVTVIVVVIVTVVSVIVTIVVLYFIIRRK